MLFLAGCGSTTPPADDGKSAPETKQAPADKPADANKDSKDAKADQAEKAVKEEKKTDKPETAVKDEKKEEKAKDEKDEKAAKPAESTATLPAHHTVKKESIKIQADLDGVFESENMTELVLRPQEWPALSVLEAVEHGAKVKKGDVLVKLDAEKIDRTIDDLRAEMKLGEISLKQAEEQLDLLEKTTPWDLEAGERNQRIAEEDRKYYQEIGKPLTLKGIELNEKFSQQGLDYEKEELDQLEKMYKADDLVEETEHLVLKRQRDAVERAEWSIHVMKLNHEKQLKYDIPRQDQQLDENFRRAAEQWKKTRVELPMALNRQRLEFERLKIQSARSDERLKKLLADREAMTVKSPADGFVYYGRCQRGKFNESAALADILRRGGVIQPNQVFMTVVEPGPLFIRASVAEDALAKIYKGVSGTAVPVGNAELKWDAAVEEVSAVPTTPGAFDARLSVALDKPAKQIVPGMTCKVKLMSYSKSDAIVVPPKTVFPDPQNEDEKIVYLLDKNGKAEKQSVKVGKQNDKQVEILKGLNEGDKILLEAPKDEK
jgi:multidrug efflux pump subunit AcrA (membrane-fusion protein)